MDYYDRYNFIELHNVIMEDRRIIMNFLLPPKLDHPHISGRLDLIGKYEPIMDFHILDICLCTNFRKNIKEILKKKGINMKKAFNKILKEEFINENINSFCQKCQEHLTNGLI